MQPVLRFRTSYCQTLDLRFGGSVEQTLSGLGWNAYLELPGDEVGHPLVYPGSVIPRLFDSPQEAELALAEAVHAYLVDWMEESRARARAVRPSLWRRLLAKLRPEVAPA